MADDIYDLLRYCEAYFLTLGDGTDRLSRNVRIKIYHSHIVTLLEHVSATPVTIIRVCYNKNTINIQ